MGYTRRARILAHDLQYSGHARSECERAPCASVFQVENDDPAQSRTAKPIVKRAPAPHREDVGGGMKGTTSQCPASASSREVCATNITIGNAPRQRPGCV